MRDAFAAEVTQLGQADPRVVLLSGDIGNRLFDKLKAARPRQFINCGIAEANMMSMAAGMAMSGLRPVVYTITPFVTYRCLEQICVDVCYHDVPVTIVGTGSGLSYASFGATHQSLEDMSCLRSFPNMTVLAPADPLETRGALRAALAQDGPVYIRLGKKGEKPVHADVPAMTPGHSHVLREGRDVCLLGIGVMTQSCLAAAEELAAHGISARVVSFYSVKPLDEKLLRDVFARFRLIVTVEEHGRIGGAGTAVAEWLVEMDRRSFPARLLRLGTGDVFMHENAHTEAARRFHGIDKASIVDGVRQALSGQRLQSA